MAGEVAERRSCCSLILRPGDRCPQGAGAQLPGHLLQHPLPHPGDTEEGSHCSVGRTFVEFTALVASPTPHEASTGLAQAHPAGACQ